MYLAYQVVDKYHICQPVNVLREVGKEQHLEIYLTILYAMGVCGLIIRFGESSSWHWSRLVRMRFYIWQSMGVGK